MEIKIVKNSHEFEGVYLTGDYVLETTYVNDEDESVRKYELYLYDIKNNEREIICKSLPKYDLGSITNVSVNRENIYFITGDEVNNGFEASLVRYNICTGNSEIVYSFAVNLSEYWNTYRLRIFVLNDMCVLLQKEEKISNMSNTYSGYFKYELKLYNVAEDKIYDVLDENLNKNGIDKMEAVSETIAVIKTGFSLLPDKRYNVFEKEEVSVEGISFLNIAQFISNIMIGQNNITMDVMDQGYYTRTFPYMRVEKDVVIYSAVNTESKEEEVVIYNFVKKEKKNCINKNVVRMSDLAKIHTINGIPYLMLTTNKKTSFINLETMKAEIEFDHDVSIKNVFNDVFVVTGTYKKGIVRKVDTPYFEVYAGVPKKNKLIREKGEYICSVYTDNDELYIFEK